MLDGRAGRGAAAGCETGHPEARDSSIPGQGQHPFEPLEDPGRGTGNDTGL